MIDTFLNSVYVYEDKIVFTYNFRDHAETVTLDEIEYVFCSDVNDCPPPNKKHDPVGSCFLLISPQLEGGSWHTSDGHAPKAAVFL